MNTRCRKKQAPNKENSNIIAMNDFAKVKKEDKASGCTDIERTADLGYEKAKQLLIQYSK